MTAAAERMPKLSKYELLEEVGHGGMATVYRAVDRRLGREVAVKVIHRHLRENTEVAARFVSEARAVAKLKHRNIVEVYDVSDLDEDDRYLVAELVKGRTLRELIRAQRFLPPEIAAAIALEIAAGLEHAHQAGVIHRDVKPENVLLAEPECSRGRRADSREPVLAEVKITDFGIAKLLDAQGVTVTGQVLGSPAHMAPEQIEGGPVSVRADVFGVGVLMYESMVGRLPFEGSNPAQVLRRVLEGTFTLPERGRPTIGSVYGNVIARALAHQPEDRYASIAELSDALRMHLNLLGFSDLRKELTSFLVDPDRYREVHQERVVERLASAAVELRAKGDIPGAAALFNRALAYRPDDAELLRAVTGIARAERLGRALRRSGLIAAGLLVSVGLAWGGATMIFAAGDAARVHGLGGEETADSADVATPGRDSETVKLPEKRPIRSATLDSKLAQSPKTEQRTVSSPRAASSTSPSRPVQRGERAKAVKPPTQVRPVTRKVRVHISGAGGGKLRIDGQQKEWFGVEHELVEGQHTIEFVPPNDECCIAPPPQVITVAPGSGPQQVHGHIEFRNALVRLSGRPGSVLRCGELFPGELESPGERAISMSRPVLEASCTLIAPPDTGEAPKAIDVTLQPGGTFNVVEP